MRRDFHHCGLTNGDDIADYSNRQQVQTCELVNLADLATEAEYVRGRLATYVNDLLSLGVDGLRLDAAKHIATGDIANILGRLSRSPYITQEVIFGGGEPITPAEYVSNGDVQEFRYTSTLQNAFQNRDIAGLQNLENRGWVAGSSANVFVANHDTERGGSSLNVNSANNAYVIATIFSLAHPYGTPTILSSYSFSNNDAGAPNGGTGTCSGTGGSNGWHCQHRWIAFSGMVAFRNAVGSASLRNWVSPQNDRIAFERDSAGFVAINSGDSSWSATFSTSLPAGTYCDVIGAVYNNGSCGGSIHSKWRLV
uniref:alpha-amylase n=1 Tax=Flammulina velutipes TaxID=38945 RepID=A0A1B2U6U7_FLAVE|nr:alpha-amylase [Flammulina velutipes]